MSSQTPNLNQFFFSFLIKTNAKMIRLTRNTVFRIKNYQKSKSILSAFNSVKKENHRRLISLETNQFKCNETNRISLQKRLFSSETISPIDYEHFCSETLESLGDYFEELVESTSELETADVLNKVNALFSRKKNLKLLL